ncbi:hypothetical protein Q5P01_019730 [Channa striata]|uniref:Uncharacterized protein n=1 Tax=Channa striata TaxID=64152 RepID=A0AA88M1M2_CHASR|nr:hypothetical protein Q5P01_019730 [Channa striata]
MPPLLVAEGWRLTANAFSVERMKERGNSQLSFRRFSQGVSTIADTDLRGAFFMDTRRLKMSRGVNTDLLHKCGW